MLHAMAATPIMTSRELIAVTRTPAFLLPPPPVDTAWAVCVVTTPVTQAGSIDGHEVMV